MALTNPTGMFWGCVLEPGKRVTHSVEAAFHMTMAAIEPKTGAGAPNKPTTTTVLLEADSKSFVLCNLNAEQVMQQPLDLVFSEGEEVTFVANGECKVHLTGYIMPDDEYDDEDEDMFDQSDLSDEEGEEDITSPSSSIDLKAKRKGGKLEDGPGKKVKLNDGEAKATNGTGKGKKVVRLDSSMDDDDDEDEDDDEMGSDEIGAMMQGFDDDEDDDDEDDYKSSEEDTPAKKGKGQQGKKGVQMKTPGKDGQQGQNQVKKTPHPQKGSPGGKNQKTPNQKLPQQQGGKKPFQSGGKNQHQNNSPGSSKQGGGKFQKSFQKKPWMASGSGKK